MSKINHCHSIADLKRLARSALPKTMFDYIEGGAEDEITCQRNKQVFKNYQFLPRVLRDVSSIDLTTTIQGKKSALPIMIAPTAMSRLFHYQGEIAVARAANSMGIPYSLSTVATSSIEEVAAVHGIEKYFQIYVMKDRSITRDFIQRCKEQKFHGLMLAVDLPVLGNRERDIKNGQGRPLKYKFKLISSAMFHPKWFWRFITSEKPLLANLKSYLMEHYHDATVEHNIHRVNEQLDDSIDWQDAKSIRNQWQGNFLLKGIQSIADAKLAAEMGATGIILSNHGGRQLDGSTTALELLPKVREIVGDQVEIFIDGGIRRGSDVIKALALGASACLIGRPYLYGLAAGGEEGVIRTIEIFKAEMERVMKLIGCQSIKEIKEEFVKMKMF